VTETPTPPSTLDLDEIEKMVRDNVAVIEAELVGLASEKARLSEKMKAKRAELEKAKRMLPRAPQKRTPKPVAVPVTEEPVPTEGSEA
jgi:hypothetical protein